MIRKLLLGLLILFNLPVLVANMSIQAATPIFTPFCFVAAHCINATSGCSIPSGHRAKLTVEPGKGPLPNSKVYVITCVSAADGQHCTSGNSAINTHLTYPPMPADLGYVFEGLFKADGTTPVNQTMTNPLTSNVAGDLSVPVMEWQDFTPDGHERRFLGIGETQPAPTTDPNLGLGGQQLGELVFDWEGALKKCIPLAWDPDGKVFDSQSLEPIPGVSVTLTKKRTNGNFTFVNKFDPNDVPDGILTNPYLTLADGGFSFFVSDGTYKLTPQVSSYSFPGSLTLNSNYSKAYYNIYPLLSGIEIIEKGSPQHRDVPVDPSGGQPTFFPIKMMEYNYQSDRISSVFVDGRVSHPLATINAYSVIPDPSNTGVKIRYKLVKTILADKVGRFSLIIDQSAFDKDKSEMFGEIEAIKADFGLSGSDTNPAPAILKLNPILTYIAGNASYNNQVLPGVTVELLLDSSTKPYYETVADSQGYFKIPSEYIPFMPYKLRYSSGGTVVVSVTTSKFITDNSADIKIKKTNFFYPQYSKLKINDSIKKSIAAYNKELSNSANDQGSGQEGVSGNNVPQPTGSANQPVSKSFVFIGIVLVIVVLLVGVGVLGVYLIKKNQQNTPPVI